MKRFGLLCGLLALGLILAVAGRAAADEGGKNICPTKVPKKVLDAAKKAVEGIKITRACVEKEDGQTVYELSGKAEGKAWQIEVTAEGKVLEVEEKKGGKCCEGEGECNGAKCPKEKDDD
jgi:hypothetical protein